MFLYEILELYMFLYEILELYDMLCMYIYISYNCVFPIPHSHLLEVLSSPAALDTVGQFWTSMPWAPCMTEASSMWTALEQKAHTGVCQNRGGRGS